MSGWRIVHFCVFCFAAAVTLSPARAADASRPNILILLADDVGFSDLGCYGGEIRTPNLDALAKGGLRFTQFYNSARCCPSRASLLTGLYPHQAGVGLMTSDKAAKFPGAGDQGEQFPGYRGALNEHCVTIGQVLKSAGYRTAALGKWHVGDRIIPTSHGFDDFYGFVSGYGVDSWEPRMMVRLPEGRPQRSYKPGEFFATDAITDHALDFLADMRKEKSPWFMYVGYQAAHFPVQSKKEDMAGYAELYASGWDRIREERLERQKKLGLVPQDGTLTPRSKIPHPDAAKRMGSITSDGKNPAWDSLPADRRADLAQRMAVYAGMITGMDRNIGRLIEDLRQSGQLDNTLIVFLSDNGACAEWEPFGFEMQPTKDPQPGHGINQGTQALPNKLYTGEDLAKMGQPGSFPSYGSGWANACNTPWRLYKHYAHEGGIATPLIAHWPTAIPRSSDGKFIQQPGHLVDLMATCVELAGAKYPKESAGTSILPMEGISLAPILKGAADTGLTADRILYFEHEGNAAVRAGDWKLVRVGKEGPWELYDIKSDRTELKDLAKDQPDKVKDLAAKWEAWAERTHVKPYPGTKVNAVKPAATAVLAAAPTTAPTTTTLIYKKTGDRELKLFVEKTADWKPADKRPAIVFYFGGGWVGGTPTQFQKQSEYLATRGMVGVRVEYRTIPKGDKGPPTVCCADAKSAMRYVRAHAAELGIDPNRIAAAGGSAGGHLAAFTSLVDGQDDPKDDLKVSCKPNALVLFNPVFNNGPGQWGHERVGDRFMDFSPAHHVTKEAPPTIVFLGDDDKLIPVATLKKFESDMKQAGVRCDAKIYPKAGHGFFNKEPHFTQTLIEGDKFLASLGWIEGTPTIKTP